MAYKVIKMFTDLKDGGHRYNEGDAYPRKGTEASEARIAELSGAGNRQGTPLIKEVAEKKSETKSEETAKESKPRVRKPKKED